MIPRNKTARPIQRAALRLAGIYCLIGILWILFSDQIAQIVSPTPGIFLFIESVKGWLFVIATAVGLYYLISRMISRVNQLDTELSQQNLEHKLEMGHY